MVLVLDEPFSGLDPRAVDTMVDLLRERDRAVDARCSSPATSSTWSSGSATTWSCSPAAGSWRRAPSRSCGPAARNGCGWSPTATPAGSATYAGSTSSTSTAPTALLELDGDGDVVRRTLLTEGLARGEVRELTRVTTPLAEIYREVTA